MTIVALPAVWLVNQDADGSRARPNVAAVGLPAGDGADGPVTATEPIDPMGDVDARYLAATAAPPPPAAGVSIAVGSSADTFVGSARAIYRRSVDRLDTCLYSGVAAGSLIRVVNVANGRSVECWTALRPPDAPQDELVLHPDRFVQIADLTNAPIDVEIRQ